MKNLSLKEKTPKTKFFSVEKSLSNVSNIKESLIDEKKHISFLNNHIESYLDNVKNDKILTISLPKFCN